MRTWAEPTGEELHESDVRDSFSYQEEEKPIEKKIPDKDYKELKDIKRRKPKKKTTIETYESSFPSFSFSPFKIIIFSLIGLLVVRFFNPSFMPELGLDNVKLFNIIIMLAIANLVLKKIF